MLTKKILGVAAATAMLSTSVYAGGFEKVTQWSAKWSSLAGAATAGVGGADAVFFNPAGMGKFEGKNQISTNLSPTFGQFDGPITTSNSNVEGERNFSPLFGILYTRKISDKFTVGGGVYAAAGTNAEFESVDYTSLSATAANRAVQSKLGLVEFTLAGSYQVNENLSLGAAWRAGTGSGQLQSATFFSAAGGGVASINHDNLSGEEFDGFRFGAQWTDERWGLGFAWRSAMNYEFDADTTVVVDGAASSGTGTVASTIGNTLPEAYSLGGFFSFNETWTLHSEVTYTDYSVNDEVIVNNSGVSITGAAGAGTAIINGVVDANVTQNWRDQWNLKFGLEQVRDGWDFRYGYAYTSNVTPEGDARAAFSSPGPAHTFAFGSGNNWGAHQVDLGVEYSLASGDGSTPGNATLGSSNVTGEFESDAYVAHASYTYNF